MEGAELVYASLSIREIGLQQNAARANVGDIWDAMGATGGHEGVVVGLAMGHRGDVYGDMRQEEARGAA